MPRKYVLAGGQKCPKSAACPYYKKYKQEEESGCGSGLLRFCEDSLQIPDGPIFCSWRPIPDPAADEIFYAQYLNRESFLHFVRRYIFDAIRKGRIYPEMWLTCQELISDSDEVVEGALKKAGFDGDYSILSTKQIIKILPYLLDGSFLLSVPESDNVRRAWENVEPKIFSQHKDHIPKFRIDLV